MLNIVANLHEIDCYSRFTEEDFIVLSLFYFYKFNNKPIDIFSKQIVFYEKFIYEYNCFIASDDNKNKFTDFLKNNESYIQECLEVIVKEPWKYLKPVIWDDRNKGDYYIGNLTDSHRFELYIEAIFRNKGIDIGLYYGKDEQYSGESKVGIEIKNDKESEMTGNLYIEYEERLNVNRDFVDSGILKNDNTIYWAIGNYKFIFFIKKCVLIDIMNNKYPDIKIKHTSARRGTSKGYLLSIKDMERISEPIEEVIKYLQNIDITLLS